MVVSLSHAEPEPFPTIMKYTMPKPNHRIERNKCCHASNQTTNNNVCLHVSCLCPSAYNTPMFMSRVCRKCHGIGKGVGRWGSPGSGGSAWGRGEMPLQKVGFRCGVLIVGQREGQCAKSAM